MKTQENIYRVITGDLPRKNRLYPRVIRVLSHKNQYPLPKERKFSDTQICIHFSETKAPFEVSVNGRKYSAECPRIYIKRAEEVHYTTCSDENVQYSFDFIYDAKEHIERLIPENLVLFPLELSLHLHTLVDNTRELLPHVNEYGVCDRIDELCYSILHEILLTTQSSSRKISLHEQQIQRAVSWLHLHMLSPIDWKELAERFGFSERSFKRYWKTYINVTPHQYLISLRMAETKRLLAETNLSIEEIAGKVCYSSRESLDFAFRKHFGFSLSAFRRKQRS